MTSVVMFSNINEPLLTKLKERFADIDLEWLVKQGNAVSDTQRNIVRAECQDKTNVHLMVFPHSYHATALSSNSDPRWVAWSKEVGIKAPRERFMHDGVSLHIY